MKIELPFDEMVELLRFASLGKMMTGLIHNLNSPLQNLGMDIELTGMLLKNKNLVEEEIKEKLTFRLARMENEFDRINQLLNHGTINVQMDEYYLKSMTLNLFIQQVLKIMEANLYFKHSVRKEMSLDPDLPKVGDRSRDFWFAVIWFIQSMVDHLEKDEIKQLAIETSNNGEDQTLIFRTKEGRLSDGFLSLMNNQTPSSDHLSVSQDAVLGIALHILRSENVVCRAESTASETRVSFLITH